jgi:hypothetical protein
MRLIIVFAMCASLAACERDVTSPANIPQISPPPDVAAPPAGAIPAHLAYEGQPEKPQGMLVFDIELLRIVS